MRNPAGIDAEEPDRRLLVRVQEVRRIREIVEGRIARYQSAVITPIESNPGEFQVGLILEMSCLIEGLVVVDAENFGARDASAKAGDLRREVSRPGARKHRTRPKTGAIRAARPHASSAAF